MSKEIKTIILVVAGIVLAVLVLGLPLWFPKTAAEQPAAVDTAALRAEETIKPTVTQTTTPEPTPELTPEPTPVPTTVPPLTAEELAGMANKDLDYPIYTCFDNVNGGFILERPYAFAIGLPADYQSKPMNFAFYSIPELAGYRTEVGYGPDYERNVIFCEDAVDLIMERNPDTIVVVMEFYIPHAVVKEMLACLEALNATDWETTICCGWSAGGNRALMTAYELVTGLRPDDTVYVVLNDCNHTEQLIGPVMDELAKHDVRIVQLTSAENPIYHHKQMHLLWRNFPIGTVKAGFTWQPGYTTHVQRKMISIYENIFGFILGDASALPGELYDVSYAFGYFDYGQGATVWTSRKELYEYLTSESGP